MAPGRTAFLFTALALLTVALFTADLLVGSVSVAPADIWAALTGGDCDPAIRDIILRIRLLKAVTALLAGAALAASGLQMQTLFRNPLAGPYVLGISSGAGLGVALFLLGAPLLGVSAHSFVQSLGIAGAAWLGAALVLLVVMAVSRRIKDIMVILILGMMFGSGISSIVEILQYLSSEAALKSFVIWTMGSLGDVTGGNLALMLPVVAAGLVLSVAAIKPLNLLLLGENYARTMGSTCNAPVRCCSSPPYCWPVPSPPSAAPWASSDWPSRTWHACSSPAPTTASSCRDQCSRALPCCWSATSFRKPWRCRSTPSRP